MKGDDISVEDMALQIMHYRFALSHQFYFLCLSSFLSEIVGGLLRSWSGSQVESFLFVIVMDHRWLGLARLVLLKESGFRFGDHPGHTVFEF